MSHLGQKAIELHVFSASLALGGLLYSLPGIFLTPFRQKTLWELRNRALLNSGSCWRTLQLAGSLSMFSELSPTQG